MTNPVLHQLRTRRSVREFTGESVSEQDLRLILQAGQQAPTSINGQQVSLIVTRDRGNIARIAEISGGQKQVAHADVFITILIDFNRTALACELVGETQKVEQSLEGLIVGALDAGIMLNALQTAANSLGYGTTAIGGIRRDPQAMIDLLKLPKRTFPINGMTLGVPKQESLPQIKPRVPLESFAMMEAYDNAAVQQGVEQYDETLRNWWDEQGMTKMPGYSKAVANFYKNTYYPSVAQILNNQGFVFES